MGPNLGLTPFSYRHRLQLEMLQTFAFFEFAIPPDRFTLHRECGKSHDKPLSNLGPKFCRCFPSARAAVSLPQGLPEASQLEDQRKAPANKGPGVLDSFAKEAISSGCKRLQTIHRLREHPKYTTVEDGLTYVASERPRPRSLIHLQKEDT